jgi:hypothetical protein
MSNFIKSGTTILTSYVKGDVRVGVDGESEYGPTENTGFYNGITPPVGGYTIYVLKESQGPSIHVAYDDSQCIFFLKSFGSTGTTISDVLAWSDNQSNIWVTSSDLTANDLIITPTSTPTPTPTPTNTSTPTPTPTNTPTNTPTPTNTSAPINGLQFYLQTAPSSGTVWTDSTGNGKNATINGDFSYVSNNGGGIKLNNTDYTGTGYISVPYNISSNTATIEIVASFNNTSHWATIWGNEAYNLSKGYFAYMGATTSLNWGSPTSNTTNVTITASNTIRHWVFVINGTTKTLYLNGSQFATATTNNPTGGYATSEFLFGARHTNAGTGATDKLNNTNSANQAVFYQMRVYNTALSSSDVTTNFNEIKSTYGL